jgi:hypothetical protein
VKWGYSSAGFDYSEELGRYLVRLNDQKASAEESKRGQSASTVVIQYVKQRPSAYFDKGGGNTPHAQTIGTGRAIVMRDGLAWDATWSRPTAEDGTTFTLDDGRAIAFKPGQVWIVLLDSKRRARLEPTSPAGSSASGSPRAQ